MNNTNQIQELSVPVVTRLLQIIGGAMCFGLILGTAVIQGMGIGGAMPEIMTYLGLGLAVMALVMQFAMAKVFDKQASKQSTPESILPVYMPRTIVRYAMMEGVGFFNAVASKPPYAIIAAGICIVGIILIIPTKSRVENWLRNIVEMKSFND